MQRTSTLSDLSEIIAFIDGAFNDTKALLPPIQQIIRGHVAGETTKAPLVDATVALKEVRDFLAEALLAARTQAMQAGLREKNPG